MSNYLNNNPTNDSVYTYLTQVQTAYLQYIQLRTQLTVIDDNLNILNGDFVKSPTQQKLHAVQVAWNKKSELMQHISHVVDKIVINLTEATKIALSSIQTNLVANNKFGTILYDSDIAPICSLVEQDSYHLSIKEIYKQYCILHNITMQISDIEIRAQMIGLSLPNFDHLKKIIRGY